MKHKQIIMIQIQNMFKRTRSPSPESSSSSSSSLMIPQNSVILNPNDSLVAELLSLLTLDEQFFFKNSLLLAVNTKPDEFAVPFEDIYQWLGFSLKANAKRLLTKKFRLNEDYIIGNSLIHSNDQNLLIRSDEQVHGGHNAQEIYLKVKSFKKFCLMAGTDQSQKVYDYYIKLEDIIQKKVRQEAEQLKLQLEQKSFQLAQQSMQFEEKSLLLEEKTVIEQRLHEQLEKKEAQLVTKEQELFQLQNVVYKEAKKRGIVYAMTDGSDTKIGTAEYSEYRRKQLQTGNSKDLKVIHNSLCSDPELAEKIIHKLLWAFKKLSGGKEWFEGPENFFTGIIAVIVSIVDVVNSSDPKIHNAELLSYLMNKLLEDTPNTSPIDTLTRLIEKMNQRLPELESVLSELKKLNSSLIINQPPQSKELASDPYIEWISEWLQIDQTPTHKRDGLHSVTVMSVFKKCNFNRNLIVNKDAFIGSINRYFGISYERKNVMENDKKSAGWQGLKFNPDKNFEI